MLVGGTPTSNLPASHNSLVFSPLSQAAALEDEILQQLTEVSIRQQKITEHRIRPRRSAVRTAPARLVPLPDPRVQVTQLLPKMTAYDDVEDFLL